MHGDRRTVALIDAQTERAEGVIDLSAVRRTPLIVAVQSFAADEHAYVGCESIDQCMRYEPRWLLPDRVCSGLKN